MLNIVIVYSECIIMTEIEMKVSLLYSSRTTYCILFHIVHKTSCDFNFLVLWQTERYYRTLL